MEKKNDSTILLLLLAGFGVYWLTKKKPTNAAVTIPADQGNISTQPVIDQPISVTPKVNDQISTQPIYEQPIYVEPTIEQPVQSVEYTPISDMFNTVWQPNYVEKTPIDAVYNMNIQPIE